MTDFVARPTGALANDSARSGRQHVRVVVAWKARIIPPTGEPVDAKVVDLSEGGLGFLSPRAVAEAPEVEVWLAVPVDDNRQRHQALRVHGQITFQIYAGNECRIGLKFVRLEEATRQLLVGWIRKHRI